MDEEKAHAIKNGSAKVKRGVVVSHDGVGDPFTYRKRDGRFTVYEWAIQIALPVAVVLLGAAPSLSTKSSLQELMLCFEPV